LQISRSQIDQVLQALADAGHAPGAQKPRLRAIKAGDDEIDSSQARTAELCEMIASLPEVRPERLAEVAASLASGKYDPTAVEIAEKLLGRALADRLK
jgi:hypothetical protein